jgi:hypothetical protein
MLIKLFRICRMHENKAFFLREINLTVLIFFEFLRNISKKIRYFNIGFVSYSVKIQLWCQST